MATVKQPGRQPALTPIRKRRTPNHEQPCDETDTPLYSRSKDAQQIWVLLLEKAYAKMHGCYEVRRHRPTPLH